jgi:Cytosine deaminase and related metal-dependent hydrolases
MEKLLLFNCSALIDDGKNGYSLLDPAYIGITDDTISCISGTRPEGEWTEKNMHGALLIPGLINTHTHAAMTLLRGHGSGLPLDRWLNEAIFPVEDRMVPADMAAGNALAQLEMLANRDDFPIPTCISIWKQPVCSAYRAE